MQLQKWLDDRGMSAAELARDLDVDPSVVSRTLTGRRAAPASLITRFFFRYGAAETTRVFESPITATKEDNQP